MAEAAAAVAKRENTGLGFVLFVGFKMEREEQKEENSGKKEELVFM